MRKICFVVGKLYNGGAERVVSILANAFLKRGYETTIVYFESAKNEYYVDKCVKRKIIPFEKGKILTFINTIKFIKKKNFDIVIGFDIFPNLICSTLALITNKKIVISERNAPKQVSINPLLRLMRYIVYGFADIVVFQTEEAMNCYRKGISKKGIVIKNPVIPNLPKRSKIHKKEIVAMGRLTKQKNYSLLLQAAKEVHEEFPEYVFKIYGQGELKYELERTIKQYEAEEYVLLKGYCDDVCKEIVDADIFVMTSLYEGMPNSLIEAMCMGFPVISSDCPSGGPRELIKHKENGLLFKNNDLEDLVKQIKFLLKDPIVKESYAAKAQELKKELSEENIINSWIEVIM